MRKTLITGVAGFIGFHTARSEMEKGNYIIYVGNSSRNISGEIEITIV